MGCSPTISVSDPFPGSLCLPLEGELESCLAGDLLPYGRLSTSGTLWKYHLKPWLVTKHYANIGCKNIIIINIFIVVIIDLQTMFTCLPIPPAATIGEGALATFPIVSCGSSLKDTDTPTPGSESSTTPEDW